ncbi:lateral signaling target protein 2 homolog isoform X1 [Argiope bruennichi]|uniref:Lateral signaling target protein 2 homolog n=1 Tax=Argiope bruennichi TaxID=94029 RepID=A0A8T0FMZ4_ARGBR|nr:lateral signaling target protein 2 homolog isoform X1 [Argiope bruennichi]KAF8792286.1 Lateral signaling target protein 2 like protein [Argiope bruennichi]
MHSLRKWFYRPKKEDSSKLALFYWADEELTMVATELDSFDGRTDPDRCSILVSQLRICQDKVLSICNDIMDDAIPDMRANRDFRAKFPDDVLHENLAGQLWFGAECLAAGSNIIHRELESASMRPLAKALTRALDNVRCLLREQSLKNSLVYSDKVREALRIFDRLFAEFELCYVSAMVPIKSAKEFHLQQEIIVLFSETLIRALKIGLVTQEMVDDFDPSLMFTIPRLAIVWGLLLYPDGPFNVEKDSADMSELFRPFCNLLFKIRDLLWTLTESELRALEKMLCSLEEPKIDEKSNVMDNIALKASEDPVPFLNKNQLNSKQFIHDFYAYNFGIHFPENGVPESSDDILVQEKHSVDVKKSDKRHNNNIEFEVEFQHTAGAYTLRKSPEIPESDMETLVSSDFGISDYDDIFCNAQNRDRLRFTSNSGASESSRRHSRNKELEDTLCDDELRTNNHHVGHSNANGMILHSSSEVPKIVTENCSYCATNNNDLSLEHTTASLENRLSRLHEDCTCGVDSSSREHLTPSREIMRQVMRRVEIVPPGQRIAGYSSVENSPRAYHHGLLSHSFPTHPAHAPHCSHLELSTCRKMKRVSRRRSMRNSCAPSDSEIASPKRCNTNHQSGIHSAPSWIANPTYSSPLTIPRVQRLRHEEEIATNSETYSSCSSCQSISSVSSPEWDSTSPDTSSYNSECQDDEEIALALQAAEIASRNKARARFKSSRDLLHKLFVCVSGVADQLQTNYASDLRNILKCVFDMNCNQQDSCDNSKSLENQSDNHEHGLLHEPNFSETNNHVSNDESSTVLNNNQRDDDERDRSSVDSAEEAVPDNSPTQSLVIPNLIQENENNVGILNAGPPEWMPDELSSNCMACKVQFTILRRRHHCRNCGKIFCSRCSSNSIPLPRFGHLKPVRVCNQCFMYQLTNLVMQRQLFQ